MAASVYITDVETVLPEGVAIFSQTDLKGKIVEANGAFAAISGYTVEEMIGKAHNIVRDPSRPAGHGKEW